MYNVNKTLKFTAILYIGVYGVLTLYFTVYNFTKLCANAVHAFQYTLVLPEDQYTE